MSDEPYRGHIRAMRADSSYFGAEDFQGSPDMAFQIEDIRLNDALALSDGKKKAFYLVVKNAAGTLCKKKMLLNVGRRRALAAMYGPVSSEWIGKWFWVYVGEVKAFGGGKTLGYLFREKSSPPSTSKPSPVPVEPVEPDQSGEQLTAREVTE